MKNEKLYDVKSALARYMSSQTLIQVYFCRSYIYIYIFDKGTTTNDFKNPRRSTKSMEWDIFKF